MSLSVLRAIWGKQQGYVFVPRRKVSGGKTLWEEGKAYAYPEDWEQIEAYVLDSSKNEWDTYWCPHVFSKPVRNKAYALPTLRILWADLDYVNPENIPLRPNIAWKSSNDRYQAFWLLDSEYPTTDVEQVNRDLTYAIGADKGGWDITQVLRVPGSFNYKYDPPQKGQLLWAEKHRIALPDVQTKVMSTAMTAPTTSGVDIKQLLDKWGVSERTRDLLLADPSEVVVGERSERLWEIEHLLLEAGMPVQTVVEIVTACPWNKFKGRRDEVNQIYLEVLKADKDIREREKVGGLTPTGTPAVEEDDDYFDDYPKLMFTQLTPPTWLVQGIWQEKGYGIIAGEPKTYKSTLITDLALSVASGKPFLGTFEVLKQGAVLYVQEENSKEMVQERVAKMAKAKNIADFEALNITFVNNKGTDLTNSKYRKKLEDKIAELRPLLCIFDPLYMMMGALDENSASEMGGILRFLKQLRDKYDTAVILCHHFKKASNVQGDTYGNGGRNIRGSGVFHGWIESALYTQRTKEPFVTRVGREFRAAPQMGDVLVRTQYGMGTDMHYIASVEDATAGEEGTKRKASVTESDMEDVLGVLITNEGTLEELSETTGLSTQVLKQTLDVLRKKGEVTFDKKIYSLTRKEQKQNGQELYGGTGDTQGVGDEPDKSVDGGDVIIEL